MTTMLSLILAFMLSIGGSPAAGVNPGGCPGDTGIQAPIDNNRTINHFSGDYNQKTASRAISKKVGETSSINDLETVNSTRPSRFSIEKLRQVRYSDHKSYRFNSVDPVMYREEALYNPQLWNLYSYCKNTPISYIDPMGLDNYVFYDPDSFSEQARVEYSRLKESNGEPTHAYPITTEKEFVEKWNSMTDPTNVTLLFHSTRMPTAPRTIQLNWRLNQYITTNSQGIVSGEIRGFPIDKLARKTIDTLRLYICHSAETEDNTALAFTRTQNVNTVIGVIGPFNYYRFTYKPRESNKLFYFIKKTVKYKLVEN